MGIYDEIVDAYLRDLRVVRGEVLAWWTGLLAKVSSPDGDLEAAERLVRPRWPAGPVSHPRVIAVYRRYYLLIEELNDGLLAARVDTADQNKQDDAWWGQDEDLDEDGIVEPRFLLLDSLEAKDPVVASFMSRFVFAPIGANPADETS